MKTKVIAFRVTENEHEALAFLASKAGMKLSDCVYTALGQHIAASVELLSSERKRIERKAKRDAKKAAANGAQ